MKKLLVSLFLIPSFTAFSQGEKNFIDQNYIEVTGKAEMKIVPDMIYITIGINETDVKKSVDEKEAQMIEALKKLGIEVTKSLKIEDLGSSYRHKILKKDIVLSRRYELMVHDAETASSVFMALEDIGISNASVSKVDHSQMEQFRREVKVNATKAAKEKASDLAKAVDQTIGRALYIQELNNRQTFAMKANTIEYGSLAKTSNDPLQFQEINIEYSVMCRFELK